MDTKITLSFNQSVINKARRYAEDNNIRLFRLTDFLQNKVTNKTTQSLEDFPILDWVRMVSQEQETYQTKTRKNKYFKCRIF